LGIGKGTGEVERVMKLSPHGLGARRILVVDDEPLNVRVLERMLKGAGFEEVLSTSDSREALSFFSEFQPDLVLLDLHMPHLDGFEILGSLRVAIPPTQYLPVLVLTGDATSDVRERALLAGARDFLTKPFDMTEVLLRIRNLLETRVLHLRLQEHNESLEDRVRVRTRELAEAQIEILHRLALAAEYRDDVTGRHAERVGFLAALLGNEVGMVGDEVARLRRAATLHDVGKIGIPDAILMKPGALNREEFDLIRSHTEIGGRILSGSRFPLLRMAREIALSHHERWDGAGYSKGRAGEDIPLVGRLVAVADVFDSLTHVRPYKVAMAASDAVRMIVAGGGSHFDPDVVAAFVRLVDAGALDNLDERVAGTLLRDGGVHATHFGEAFEEYHGIDEESAPAPVPPRTSRTTERVVDPRDPPRLDE